ncbi:MAG: hypothetical protein HUU01_20920 [Saprospiraceae bacterium]|nr:hypothetical protein [Saprospiraceae bacterium]
MTAAAIVRKTYSLEAYFALEDKSVMKHEYDNGKLMEMAERAIGGSLLPARS